MKLLNWTAILMLMFFALPAMAQDDDASDGEDKYGETAEQRQACMEALSIYRSFRDQKNYDEAYKFWRKTCDVCPVDVSERLYSDGALFIRNEIKKAYTAKDMDHTRVLIDSLMLIYDMRLEHFSSTKSKPDNACNIKGLKASDMYTYQKKTKMKELNALFKESVDCLKGNSLAGVLSGYYISLYDLYKDSEGDDKKRYQQDLITEYLPLQEYTDFGIQNASKESQIEGYQKAKNNIDEIFVLISNCEDMVPVLQDKLASEPDNFDLKKKALRLMNAKDCTDTDFYLKTVQGVHDVEPSAESAYGLGQMYVKRNEISKALSYFEEAAELCGDCSDRENYLLKAGQAASALKQSGKARTYANRLLAINPNNGEAYLLIGDAIAGSVAACAEDKLGGRSVYWLASDYYNKAKRVDSSVSEKANKKISSVSSQFPARSDLFPFNIKDGDKFTVPCFGEETTARERP